MGLRRRLGARRGPGYWRGKSKGAEARALTKQEDSLVKGDSTAALSPIS